MMALFGKECRQLLRSLVYYIYVVVFVLFITSQMGSTEEGDLRKPVPGQEYYGYGYSTDPQDIMESALENLFLETYRNHYDTYPFGFIKVVTLNEGELADMEAELEAATGRSFEELTSFYIDYWQQVGESATYEEYLKNEADYHIPIRAGYAYEEFEEQMRRVSGMIGKGCMYDGTYRSQGMKELTYEDAEKEYEDLCKKDRITGAAMRLFCDYAGILLSILPVFVAVAVCLRDRRAKAAEVICAKRVSGAALIVSRYLATVIFLFVPVVVCAYLMQMPYTYLAVQMGVSANQLAFLEYSILWLLPMILVTTAVGFVLTELTDSVIAVLVQAVWWYGSVMSAEGLIGDFGWKLVTRWNEFGAYSRFGTQLPQLIRNRGYYAVLSLILLIASIVIFERKRKSGVTAHGKTRKAGH